MKLGRRNIFRGLIKRDFLAKIGSLVLSVILWALISSNMMDKIKFQVPIEIKNPYENLTVSKMSSRNVHVIFEGKKELTKNITVKSVRAYIDIKNPEIGKPKKYPIQFLKTDVPENVTVSFSVRDVTATVEKKSTRIAKVVAKIIGSPKRGYVIGRITINPEALIVSGAGSVIENINTVSTEGISVENESADIIRDVEIDREHMDEAELNRTSVRVVVPLYKLQDLTGVKINVAVINASREFKYTLRTPAVKIYIRSAGVQSAEADKFEAYVDVGAVDLRALFGENINKSSVEIELPVKAHKKNDAGSADIAYVEPETVTVKITRK